MMTTRMSPEAGTRHLVRVGDELSFSCTNVPQSKQAYLRCNIGHASAIRTAIIAQVDQPPTTIFDDTAITQWQDLPMHLSNGIWSLTVTAPESGFFEAKTWVETHSGDEIWPAGENCQIVVHPTILNSNNTTYCAFVRNFGNEKNEVFPGSYHSASQQVLTQDYTCIPPSGTLRDLGKQLPHIFERLHAGIVHLLPIQPTPTTFARYGRFGSPYAATDFTSIDPALIEHDKRTTALEQFSELVDAIHDYNGQLIIDLAINHSGWGAHLQEEHPEWYARDEQGNFVSPGAWGNIWEDLSELDYEHKELWQSMAEVFLTWCRRGVDGFRCDAGYMIPLPAWQYIIARVHQLFPHCIFLLEGLGGAWPLTENLLAHSGMQWAYSELFQNYDAPAINSYLTYHYQQAKQNGTLIHYSETHDNNRLAEKGRHWSLFRNRLCALTSSAGGFAYTAGVEWLCTDKIIVHERTPLNWGNRSNIVKELGQLATLLRDHPCFHADAELKLLSNENDNYILLRRSHTQSDTDLYICANPDEQARVHVPADAHILSYLDRNDQDLLGQKAPPHTNSKQSYTLLPLHIYCFEIPTTRQTAPPCAPNWSWACEQLHHSCSVDNMHLWKPVWNIFHTQPEHFLSLISNQETPPESTDVPVRVSRWQATDASRIMPVPEHHWLLIEHDKPFQCVCTSSTTEKWRNSRAVAGKHIATIPPQTFNDTVQLTLRAGSKTLQAELLFCQAQTQATTDYDPDGTILLTNSRGGMAWMPVNFARIDSKYNCVLAANFDEATPCDRWVLVKRLRAWARIDHHSIALDTHYLQSCSAGPAARWTWLIPRPNGTKVTITLSADMPEHANTTILHFESDTKDLSIIARLDLENRSFHAETHIEQNKDHFRQALTPQTNGYSWTVHAQNKLRVFCDHGCFHSEEEICQNIHHPVEAQRGLHAAGDAWSPGWFSLSFKKGSSTLTCCAEQTEQSYQQPRPQTFNSFSQQLHSATLAYVVRRDDGRSVIAGYPWFLDWGRDTLICARGLLAAGLTTEVRDLLKVFGRFEEGGTLPNCIFGENATNRETSDAPLWYGVVAEDYAATVGKKAYHMKMCRGGNALADVLRNIAVGYLNGTTTGITVDPASGLVWSPSHFTWMDTNHPAGTPRVGYPVEIQALWLRLLKQLIHIKADAPHTDLSWTQLYQQAEHSFHELFTLDEGYLADALLGPAGTPAHQATADNALRSNQLIAVSLGIITGKQAQSIVQSAQQWLIIPGAIRSLAPKSVSPPLPIYSDTGTLLNDPNNPYCGYYGGDEDSKRKPAYHNGTAWTWPFPVFCEAWARAWDMDPAALTDARDWLSSMRAYMTSGCLGQIPEIADGDAPHTQRGCLAQAWGVTEALRVWKLLEP